LVYHCELQRLYTKKSRPGIPFPASLTFCKFCKTPLLPRLQRRASSAGVQSGTLTAFSRRSLPR
jgi:RNase P subunit RPR2